MPKKHILKDFELTEISSVDRPAQPTAIATIMKRDEDQSVRNDVASIIKGLDGVSVLNSALIQESIDSKIWPLTNALQNSMRKVLDATELSDESKAFELRNVISSFSDKLEKELIDETNPLTKILKRIAMNKEDETMPKHTPEEQAKKDKEEKDALTTKISALETELAKTLSLAQLNDTERSFMCTLDDTGKDAFIELSLEKRKEKIELSKKADEIITVNGAEIMKSVVGASMFSVIKAQQEQLASQEAAITKAAAITELAVFTKRATDDFNHLTGTNLEVGMVLKHIDTLPEEVKKHALSILTSAEKGAKRAFIKQGGSGPVSASEDDPGVKLDTLAKAYAATSAVSYAAAYDHVIMNQPELYQATLEQAQH